MNRNFAVGVGVAMALHLGVALALSFVGQPDRTAGLTMLVDVETETRRPPPPKQPPPPPARPEPEPEVEPDVRPEPTPRPRSGPATAPQPTPQPARAAKPRLAAAGPAVRDVSDSSFADNGTWALDNRPDNPEAAEGPVVVGAANEPAPDPEPLPPGPPGPPGPARRAAGSAGAPAAGAARPAFRPATDVSRRPEVLQEVRADYPDAARREGIQGAVRLLVMIRKDGAVYRVIVIDDPGGGLGDAARRALEGFRFSPAIGREGAPVDYQIYYTYRFVLDA